MAGVVLLVVVALAGAGLWVRGKVAASLPQLDGQITAPELDAQYSAAVADARNKRVNAKRLTALAPAGVVSAQELELGQASADVNAPMTNVNADGMLALKGGITMIN